LNPILNQQICASAPGSPRVFLASCREIGHRVEPPWRASSGPVRAEPFQAGLKGAIWASIRPHPVQSAAADRRSPTTRPPNTAQTTSTTAVRSSRSIMAQIPMPKAVSSGDEGSQPRLALGWPARRVIPPIFNAQAFQRDAGAVGRKLPDAHHLFGPQAFDSSRRRGRSRPKQRPASVVLIAGVRFGSAACDDIKGNSWLRKALEENFGGAEVLLGQPHRPARRDLATETSDPGPGRFRMKIFRLVDGCLDPSSRAGRDLAEGTPVWACPGARVHPTSTICLGRLP